MHIKLNIAMKKIGVLGCGWLGLPLAKFIAKNGYSVNGSNTGPNKSELLKEHNIKSFIVKINENGIEGDLNFFKKIDFLIITIPPGLKKNPNERFERKIEICKNTIEKYGIKEVVFISSISVYGELNGIVTENSSIKPISNSANQLVSCEKILINSSRFKTVILRMGGLIGNTRHPIYNLSKRENILNPLGRINFIHIDDSINIIFQIIDKFHENEIYNCVSPFHPTRKKYYTSVAKLKGLNIPTFQGEKKNEKMVSSKKIINLLNYKFKVKNLLMSF